MAQLDLPTYHDFTQYQFLDVLDALSFRVMVLDHIKNKNKEEQQQAGDDNPLRQHGSNLEMDIKAELSHEVNKLIFQRKLEGTTAVKDVMHKEGKQSRGGHSGRDKSGLTSSHHMAAEATVRKMKEFIRKKKSIVESSPMPAIEEDLVESVKINTQKSINTGELDHNQSP